MKLLQPLVLLISATVLLSMSLPGKRKIARSRDASSVGRAFPRFNGVTVRGLNWDNTVFEGRITLVSLWRIGCGACMLEIPEYDALLDLVSDPRFQIISLAPQTRDELDAYFSSEKNAPIARLREAMGWKVPRYDVLPMCSTKRFKDSDELGVQCSAAEELLGADGYPVTFVVGPDGVIRHRHEGLPCDSRTGGPKLDAFRAELDSLIGVL